MTDLELLKREDQDLLDLQMMRHHYQNTRQGYGPRDSGGLLIPKMADNSVESSESSHNGRDAENNETMMSQIIA